MKKELLSKSIFLTLLLCIIPAYAYACVFCAFAVFDWMLPPIKYWIIFSIALFLTASFLARSADRKIRPLPRFSNALIIVFILLLVAAAGFGPLAILPLMLPPLVAGIRLISRNFRSKIGNPAVRKLAIMTVIMLIGVAGLFIWSREIVKTRSQVEFILKWDGAGIAKHMIKDLSNQEPFPFNDFRILLEKGSCYVVYLSLPSFNKNIDAKIAVPLLINTLERMEKGDRAFCNGIQEALQKQTDIQLPKESTASQWREAWQNISAQNPK